MKKNELQMEMIYEKIIPERYKILFELDWRNGEKCNIPYQQRLELHKLWLEMNKEECKKYIDVVEDEVIVGFPED